MSKSLAEFIGTFTLVFFGCGAAIIAGMGAGPTSIGHPWNRVCLWIGDRRYDLWHRPDFRLPC